MFKAPYVRPEILRNGKKKKERKKRKIKGGEVLVKIKRPFCVQAQFSGFHVSFTTSPARVVLN